MDVLFANSNAMVVANIGDKLYSYRFRLSENLTVFKCQPGLHSIVKVITFQKNGERKLQNLFDPREKWVRRRGNVKLRMPEYQH